MKRVLRSLFTLVAATALCAAVSACNTNGGIPAMMGPGGGGGGLTPSPAPTASPSPHPSTSPSTTPSPSPTPT